VSREIEPEEGRISIPKIRFERGQGMKKRVLCAVFGVLLIGCGKSPPAQEQRAEGPPPKVIVEREERERKPPPPPEVKIRLKKDGKEAYSWELAGSDADQILKVNEKLRKGLAGEASK
jgi:hypothetical protein